MDEFYVRILASYMDDCTNRSDPCTQLINASDATAATNNPKSSIDNLEYSWIESSFLQIYIMNLYHNSSMLWRFSIYPI